ncbi:hypothetical protein Bca101_055763 [Brassica carinata]
MRVIENVRRDQSDDLDLKPKDFTNSGERPHQVEKSANSNARHGYSTNQKRESNPRHLMNLVWAVALMDIILTSKVQFQEVELERTLRRLKEAFPTLANKRRDARQQKK